MNDQPGFDAIVVGGGLAGMLTALELQPLRVALVSYGRLGESTSSAWAQGGIAAAVGDDDSPALHAADTVAAGAGLVERRVAARLAADAPGAIERIASLGVRFDRADAAHYALGREAAHSRRRIVRAGGDAIGAELVRATVAAVRERAAIERFEGGRALDVVLDDSRHVAGLTLRHVDGTTEMLVAPAAVLATGGIGGLYRFTTNPTLSRGTGIAIAARAGARLADLEFVQFHPTALDVPSDPLPLISEAVRGEGALLVDEAGERIMAGVDAALELAPRDVVARRVFAVRQQGRRVFLDARAAIGDSFPLRFPTVFAACRRFGIDPRSEPIPVVAAAHYHMGGIAVDLQGRTNVGGLYACGEVAATGVHGANRLASNSLLESVVYPERIARDVRAAGGRRVGPLSRTRNEAGAAAPAAAAAWEELRSEMYRNVGVERDESRLFAAAARLAALAADNPSEEFRDAATVAALIAHAALLRRESRGSHIRLDYPGRDDAERHRSFLSLADATLAGTA
ncbi:MAG: L-aspartate oxidase [Candidatus Eremiobacteraeota bacterium]|nr:L-aspartate oxidase [Candidatus Eremiobacteraeota bacterium]MBC5803775.1 L-aspartate oxidase [Candidatus Eremiobacteraeota bacterium]MBC5822814.1 L-aspartate oxidase [Candidatus Eremiobacteraeota bacterium]